MIFGILLLILEPTRPKLQSLAPHLSETIVCLISISLHCNFERFFFQVDRQDTGSLCISFPSGPQSGAAFLLVETSLSSFLMVHRGGAQGGTSPPLRREAGIVLLLYQYSEIKGKSAVSSTFSPFIQSLMFQTGGVLGRRCLCCGWIRTSAERWRVSPVLTSLHLARGRMTLSFPTPSPFSYLH